AVIHRAGGGPPRGRPLVPPAVLLVVVDHFLDGVAVEPVRPVLVRRGGRVGQRRGIPPPLPAEKGPALEELEQGAHLEGTAAGCRAPTTDGLLTEHDVPLPQCGVESLPLRRVTGRRIGARTLSAPIRTLLARAAHGLR